MLHLAMLHLALLHLALLHLAVLQLAVWQSAELRLVLGDVAVVLAVKVGAVDVRAVEVGLCRI